MGKIKCVGILTSGGDAPGMNAAIRAVVRTAIYHQLQVIGIKQGYTGMINGNFEEFYAQNVSDIIQKGGTILKTARSEEFRTPEGRKKAYDQLQRAGINALVVIGGDGSFTGARNFSEEFDIPIVGIPGTIDNDLFGTDYTIGYDTALNTVVQNVDKIRDTASSHDRLFFVEVMGRDAGFLALASGVSCGAEAILVPEVKTDVAGLKSFLEKDFKHKKSSNIIIVAEGETEGGAFAIAKKVKDDFKEYDVKVTVLGHVQRGGSPTAQDRMLASRMGFAAIEALLDDQKSIMIGIANDKIVHVPFNQAIKNKKPINKGLLDLAEILSL
ncbi:MAG: 6-phosphofructokinase [Bacteroidota bacterium]|nr:6-phosphofructokinase [Bacteroidota bacterium]